MARSLRTVRGIDPEPALGPRGLAGRYGGPLAGVCGGMKMANGTLGAARILGVDDRVGSIEVGEDADLSSSSTATPSSTPATCAA